MRCLFFLLISAIFLFFSCSNQNQDSEIFEEETLRAETERMANSFAWTLELEKGRLTEKKREEHISSSVKLSPISIVSSLPQKNIFPFIDNFGSLDVTALPKSLKSEIAAFCASLSKGENVDSFMAKGCLYSLALFYRDFSEKKYKNAPWIFGNVHYLGTNWEILVRFGEDFDVLLFWTNEDETWKIDQIKIRPKQKSDEKTEEAKQ